MQSAPPSAALPTSERFVVQELLGSGGAGRVYRAYDRERDATVALKVLGEATPGSLVRFKQEFRALSSFMHPNVVHLYELITRNDQWLLTMELIDGTDLLGYVRPSSTVSSVPPDGAYESTGSHTVSHHSLSFTTRHSAEAHVLPTRAPQLRDRPARPRTTYGALDEARLRSALRQLCHGLDAIHRAGHLHRDLKPSNVLVSQCDGRVAICDFGLVLEQAAGRTQALSKHKHRQVAGTLPFMSPEQLSGEPLSAATDWYAVGVMLYLALTLRLPFGSSATVAEAAARKRENTPVAPRELVPQLAQDLSDLAMALLHPEPERRPGFAEVMAVLDEADSRDSLRVPADLLIGREEQMAQLMGALARARNGSASVVFVSGRSGMGKSQLVQRFLEHVQASQAAVVLTGRCYEREELPYKTLDPIMDALSAHLMDLDEQLLSELLPAGVHNLARLFPAFLRVPAIAKQRGVDATNPHEQKRRAVAVLRELFQNLAQQKLLVLYIDDLQWGDLDSGPILAELLRPPHAPALLLICAHRSEDQDKSALLRALLETHLPAAGVMRPPVVKVDALLPGDARELARILLGAHATQALIERVASEARGSPLFLHELATFVRRNKAKLGSDLRLDTLIETRVSQLTRESRMLLEVIATAGRPEQRGIVWAAAQLGDKALAAFHLLETQHLVRSAGTTANDRVEASHDRIRETVYRMLSDERRTELHRELALAIEREDDADPEALFDHWKAAAEPKKAGEYALAAAERSEAALAFGRAAQLYQAAQELLSPEPQSERARSLEQRLGYALMYAGHGVAASEAFFRALPGAVGSNAIELRILAITQLLRAGRVRQAFDELRQAEKLTGLPTPRSHLQTVLMLLWRRIRVRLRFLRLRWVRVDQLRLQRLDLLWGVGSALSVVDHIRGSVYQTEQMLLALTSGDPYRHSRALSLEATFSATNNRSPGRTQWLIDRGLEAAGQAGNLHGVAVIKGTAGVCRLLEGKFREAIRLTQEGIETMETRVIGMQAWEVSTLHFFHMQAQAYVGNLHELSRRVPELLRDAEARDDLYAATSFRSWRCSWAWLGPDQPDTARQQVGIAEQQWAQDGYHLQHWYATLAYGEIDLYTGAPELAWKRLNAEWRALFFLRMIQHTRCEALYLRARLALALASQRDDPKLLARARRDARSLVREGVGWALAFGRLIEASCLAFSAPVKAAAALREVEGMFDALDMTIFALACRSRRAQLTLSDEGTTLQEEANEGLRSLGVANPAAFVRMLAPGFPTQPR